MRFYYFSMFSWGAYFIYLGLLVGALAVLWTKVLKLKLTNPAYGALVAVIVVAPWIEELLIAHNFDRLCRQDAGVFVSRIVEVEGFYDDTTHWWRQLPESDYKFVESRDYVYQTLWRAELAGNEVRHFQIDKPTARYQYKRVDDHKPVAHQVWRFEDVVADTQTKDSIGRHTTYTRGPYWFFIHLDAPVMECDELRGKDPIVYRQVLRPAK